MFSSAAKLQWRQNIFWVKVCHDNDAMESQPR